MSLKRYSLKKTLRPTLYEKPTLDNRHLLSGLFNGCKPDGTTGVCTEAKYFGADYYCGEGLGYSPLLGDGATTGKDGGRPVICKGLNHF